MNFIHQMTEAFFTYLGLLTVVFGCSFAVVAGAKLALRTLEK